MILWYSPSVLTFQTWSNNMGKAGDPKVTDSRGEDYTCVTFHPDLAKFKMESLDKDIVDIFCRRAYDIAAASKGVKVMLNGKRVPVCNTFFENTQMYIYILISCNSSRLVSSNIYIYLGEIHLNNMNQT